MAASYIDLKKRSVFTYHRVLLFNYDVQCKTPFASYNRSMFSDEEIPTTWFTGPLTPANRKKVLSLPALGGGRFSVYGKIELGENSLLLLYMQLYTAEKKFNFDRHFFEYISLPVEHFLPIISYI